jgi:fermentation-respiration switch protein FrsA (DUF1100 family)
VYSSPSAAASVSPLFDLSSPIGGPFPSDRFTVADPAQNTDLRINLPHPDCTARPSDCADVDLLNELDGFNLQPRLSVPFSGPIDVATVNSRSVFLTRLGSTLPSAEPGGRVIGIDQIVWDVATSTLHFQPDEQLEQHTRYALVVTKNVLDPNGKAVKATPGFLQFIDDSNTETIETTVDSDVDAYRTLLRDTLRRLDAAGVVSRGQVVTASVFTTQSVTAVLERLRDDIKAAIPASAEFGLGPGQSRTVFRLSDVMEIRWTQQTGDNPVTFANLVLPIGLLNLVPGAVGTIAFGKYTSPSYLVQPDQYIPQVGTRSGRPTVQGTSEIFFNLFLPSGEKPSGGWPVAVFGHGGGGDKNVVPLRVAAKMAERGIATIAVNFVGNGFGPLSTLSVRQASGLTVTLPAGGRGSDQDGDDRITAGEGAQALPPRDIINVRDAFVQTAVDLMALVAVIRAGMDVDGDAIADLDPARIYFFGQSAGGNYGALLLAVEPSVRVGALIVPGNPVVSDRLSPIRRNRVGADLASRVPSLLNAPGITRIAGVSVPGLRFDENLPLRAGVSLPVELADGTARNIQTP